MTTFRRGDQVTHRARLMPTDTAADRALPYAGITGRVVSAVADSAWAGGQRVTVRWTYVDAAPARVMTATTDPYARAIAYAEEIGAEHGENAAGWYVQDVFTRGWGDTATVARRVLAGIGPQLVADAIDASGADQSTDALADAYAQDWFTDICDAYENAYSTAVENTIATAARAVLDGAE